MQGALVWRTRAAPSAVKLDRFRRMHVLNPRAPTDSVLCGAHLAACGVGMIPGVRKAMGLIDARNRALLAVEPQRHRCRPSASELEQPPLECTRIWRRKPMPSDDASRCRTSKDGSGGAQCAHGSVLARSTPWGVVGRHRLRPPDRSTSKGRLFQFGCGRTTAVGLKLDRQPRVIPRIYQDDGFLHAGVPADAASRPGRAQPPASVGDRGFRTCIRLRRSSLPADPPGRVRWTRAPCMVQR